MHKIFPYNYCCCLLICNNHIQLFYVQNLIQLRCLERKRLDQMVVGLNAYRQLMEQTVPVVKETVTEIGVGFLCLG